MGTDTNRIHEIMFKLLKVNAGADGSKPTHEKIMWTLRYRLVRCLIKHVKSRKGVEYSRKPLCNCTHCLQPACSLASHSLELGWLERRAADSENMEEKNIAIYTVILYDSEDWKEAC